jgi:hypothetical protein
LQGLDLANWLSVRERDDLGPNHHLGLDSDKSRIDKEWEDVMAEAVVKTAVKSLDNNKVDNFSVPDFQDKKFTDDYKSEMLEAYSIDHTTKDISTLHLGHHCLTSELNRTVNRNKGSVYDQIMSLDADRRKDLNRVIDTAQKLETRARTCLAIDFCNKQSSTIFFALGAPVEPVPLKPVHLEDWTGRRFYIPFEHCKLEVSAFRR